MAVLKEGVRAEEVAGVSYVIVTLCLRSVWRSLYLSSRVPNKLIYQHLYLIHNPDISMHCTYRHCFDVSAPMSSRVQPILAHYLAPATRWLPADARNGLMGAPSPVCVMLRSEGMSPQDYFRECPIRGHSIVKTAPWQDCNATKSATKEGSLDHFLDMRPS